MKSAEKVPFERGVETESAGCLQTSSWEVFTAGYKCIVLFDDSYDYKAKREDR